MQAMDCQLGVWKAYATVEEMAHHTLMAVIRIWDSDDNEKISSRHVMVFDQQDRDALSQTRTKMQELLASRYGMIDSAVICEPSTGGGGL